MGDIKFLGSLYGEHSRWGLFDTSGISPTLTAAMGMGGGYIPMILEKNKMAEIRVIGCMDHTIDHTFESANRVYDIDGIAPTIPTCCGGGLQPKVLDKQIVRMVGRNPDNPKSRIPGLPTEQRLEPKEDGICGCLTNVQKDNLVMETQIIKVGQISNEGSQYGTVISENGLSATLSAGTHGYANSCIQQKYRIRKLTVKECARLMNFDDTDYEAMTESDYYSDSQGYKMCGNSIVVSCLCAIFSQLGIKGITPWNEMSEEQKKNLSAVNRCDNSGQERSPL